MAARPSETRSTFAAYLALTKPRIIELLLITTVPTMIVAERGWPGLWLVVATVIGGTFAAGGANAVNMYVDRDIDKIMKRTEGRPLVTGEIEPRNALIFSVALLVIAGVWLAAFVNVLSAVFALVAAAFYIFVYTLWLKRTSKQNIVIGGAAGCMPVSRGLGCGHKWNRLGASSALRSDLLVDPSTFLGACSQVPGMITRLPMFR